MKRRTFLGSAVAAVAGLLISPKAEAELVGQTEGTAPLDHQDARELIRAVQCRVKEHGAGATVQSYQDMLTHHVGFVVYHEQGLAGGVERFRIGLRDAIESEAPATFMTCEGRSQLASWLQDGEDLEPLLQAEPRFLAQRELYRHFYYSRTEYPPLDFNAPLDLDAVLKVLP
jgi:hypothetical protein